MRIDRLLEITIYLLNRKKVSASELAKKFEVSVRTIQRDIDSLCLAGIPIYATHGASGGYGIIDTYRLDKQIINNEDFYFIITALKSLCTAYNNKKITKTLEKIESIISRDNNRTYDNDELMIDFTAFQESKGMKENFSAIDNSIKNRKLITFDYTTGGHQQTNRTVEPMTIVFKWHSWYLLAYCKLRSDFRIFSIPRIRNIEISNRSFKRRSVNPVKFFKPDKNDPKDNMIRVKLLFDSQILVAMESYFPQGTITKYNDNYFLMEAILPRREHPWFGLIMTFGEKIKILEPEEIKHKLLSKASEIIKLYQ